MNPKSCKIAVFVFALLILMSEATPVPGGSDNAGVEGAKKAQEGIETGKDIGKAACSVGAEVAGAPFQGSATAAEQMFSSVG